MHECMHEKSKNHWFYKDYFKDTTTDKGEVADSSSARPTNSYEDILKGGIAAPFNLRDKKDYQLRRQVD